MFRPHLRLRLFTSLLADLMFFIAGVKLYAAGKVEFMHLNVHAHCLSVCVYADTDK